MKKLISKFLCKFNFHTVKNYKCVWCNKRKYEVVDPEDDSIIWLTDEEFSGFDCSILREVVSY